MPVQYAQSFQSTKQYFGGQSSAKQNNNHHHQHQSTTTTGLIPPSGVYGVPPGGSYNGGLALPKVAHKTHFKQPTRPVLFRPPVPQGLIESIGHSVQQQDAFGSSYKNHAQTQVYLPPPASEIPPPPQGLANLPLDQGSAQLFHPSIDSVQALPYQQPRQQFNSHGASLGSSNCGTGPQFGTAISQSTGDQLFQVSSGYEAAKSNSQYESAQSTGFDYNQHTGNDFASNIITGYEQQQPTGLALNVIQVHDEHSPTSSYGPPPSGIPNDSTAFDSQVSTSISASGDERHAHAEALTGSNSNIQIVTAISGDSQGLQTAASEHQTSNTHAIYAQHVTSYENEQQQIRDAGFTQEQLHQQHQQQRNQELFQLNQQRLESVNGGLPGLDGTGLDIVSAQKSQSITIPVTGNHGTYQLQFQSANGIPSGDSNDLDSPNHQQILSDGLLQQILSAIEQPNSKSDIVPQVSSYDDDLDAQIDVDQFIKSDIGKETLLSEPKVQ